MLTNSPRSLSAMRWYDDKVMIWILVPLVVVGILCAAVWSMRGLDATLATFGISVGVTSAVITMWGALVTRNNLDRIERGVGRLASYQRREALSAVETALSSVAAARFRSSPQKPALESSLKDFDNALNLARPHSDTDGLPRDREQVGLPRPRRRSRGDLVIHRGGVGELRRLRANDQAPSVAEEA